MTLHDEEPKEKKTEKKRVNGNQTQDSPLTQEFLAPSLSTMETDLKTKIREANERRKEDAATTKKELKNRGEGDGDQSTPT